MFHVDKQGVCVRVDIILPKIKPFQLLSALFPSWHDAREQGVEAFAVVVFGQVAEFVDDEVINQLAGWNNPDARSAASRPRRVR